MQFESSPVPSSRVTRRAADLSQIQNDFSKHTIPTRIEISRLTQYQAEDLLRELVRSSNVHQRLLGLIPEAVVAPGDGASELFARSNLPDFFTDESYELGARWEDRIGFSQGMKSSIRLTRNRLAQIGNDLVLDQVFNVLLAKDRAVKAAIQVSIDFNPAGQHIPGVAQNVLKDLGAWARNEKLSPETIALGGDVSPAHHADVVRRITHPEVWSEELLKFAAFFEELSPHVRIQKMLPKLTGYLPPEVFVVDVGEKSSVKDAWRSLHLNPLTRPLGFLLLEHFLVPAAHGVSPEQTVDRTLKTLRQARTQFERSGVSRAKTTPGIVSIRDPIDQEISAIGAVWGRELPYEVSNLLTNLIQNHEDKVNLGFPVITTPGRFPSLAGADLKLERFACRMGKGSAEFYRTSEATISCSTQEGLPLKFVFSAELPPYEAPLSSDQVQEDIPEDDDDEPSPYGGETPKFALTNWTSESVPSDPLREVHPLPDGYHPRDGAMQTVIPGIEGQEPTPVRLHAFQYLLFHAGVPEEIHIQNEALREILWRRHEAIARECELGPMPAPFLAAADTTDVAIEIGAAGKARARATLTYVPALLPREENLQSPSKGGENLK